MQSTEIARFIIYLIGLSVSSGLIFALMTPSNRDRSSLILSLVGGGVVVWVSMSLLRRLSFIVGIDDVNFIQLSLNIMMSALFISGAFYFLFMVHYTQNRSALIDSLIIIITLITCGGMILIWTNNAFVVDDDAIRYYRVTQGAYVLLGLVLGYILLGFWLMLNGSTEKANFLVGPTSIIFSAYTILSFNFWMDTLGIEVILIAVAMGIITGRILRRQITNPQEALYRDLQFTNNELQRTIKDLAQEKSKTEALNRELLQANRYKDEFLSTMSHELRTPLNSIVGYSELLLAQVYGNLDEKQLDRLERIYRNGRHLTHIIDAILDLNKIDSGRMHLDVEEFNLHEAIQSSASNFNTVAEKNEIEFVIDLRDLPPYHGDYDRIVQVINIILDNAFKFTETGSVTLTTQQVSVTKGNSTDFTLPTIGWLKDGLWAFIVITDTGKGIAPEEQARIFDRFSQIDSSRTREYEGIGLGLTIARKLVELHDGLVWVKSRPENGSSFFIALPYQMDKLKQSS